MKTAKNDITGDTIKTKFDETEAYSSGWDRIFGNKNYDTLVEEAANEVDDLSTIFISHEEAMSSFEDLKTELLKELPSPPDPPKSRVIIEGVKVIKE